MTIRGSRVLELFKDDIETVKSDHKVKGAVGIRHSLDGTFSMALGFDNRPVCCSQ